MNGELEIEKSPLSQLIASDGRSVKIEIYRLKGESTWILEIEDEFNNSTVWNDEFESDAAALIEAKKVTIQPLAQSRATRAGW